MNAQELGVRRHLLKQSDLRGDRHAVEVTIAPGCKVEHELGEIRSQDRGPKPTASTAGVDPVAISLYFLSTKTSFP